MVCVAEVYTLFNTPLPLRSLPSQEENISSDSPLERGVDSPKVKIACQAERMGVCDNVFCNRHISGQASQK